MNFVSLHNHSHYSLTDGLSNPKNIAKYCADHNMVACGLTDHGTISGHIKFYEEMNKVGIKPILGCELYLSGQDSKIKDLSNRKCSHFLIYAKNKNGWIKLVKLISQANSPDRFYYKPRLSVAELIEIVSDDLVGISGHMGSDLANLVFDNNENIKPDWLDNCIRRVEDYKRAFNNNFFIEVQLVTAPTDEKTKLLVECMRELSIKTGVLKVATGDAHYVKRSDAEDHRIILCNYLKQDMVSIYQQIRNGEDVLFQKAFTEENFFIPTYDDVKTLHTEDEIINTTIIADMCENFNISNPPKLPDFQCPDNTHSSEYIKTICEQKLHNLELNDTYRDRLSYELNVINNANLSSYFLIVQDYINAAKYRGELVGISRGSSAGSLVSYLLGITGIDPIKYNLMFERFYNAGRNTQDNIALPDIDSDFEINKREDTISYIKDKYGKNNVAGIITFGKMKGKAALKDVIRAYGSLSFNEANMLCENIPDEASISDDLQEMMESTGESSIILWALQENPKKFEDYCTLEDDGSISGPYSKLFEQAMRLEGTIKNQSKHASGYIISSEPLGNTCPMVYDTKTGNQIVGFEFKDAEKIGQVKFDILGIAMLDKMMCVKNLLRGN